MEISLCDMREKRKGKKKGVIGDILGLYFYKCGTIKKIPTRQNQYFNITVVLK